MKVPYILTHCILVDSSTVMYWTSPFVILWGVRSILSLSVMDKSICHFMGCQLYIVTFSETCLSGHLY